MKHKLALGFAAITSAALVTTLIGNASAGPNDNSLVIGASQEPQGLEPWVVNQSIAAEVYTWMYRNLAYVDLEGDPQPDLAEQIPSEQNGRVKITRDAKGDPTSMSVRWTLRDNLKWSDGRPITSEDVRFSFEVFQDQRIPVPNRANAPKRVTVVDDRSFEVVYEPAFLFYQYGAYGTQVGVGNYIAPAHVWKPIWERVKAQLEGKSATEARDIVAKQLIGAPVATSRQGPPVTSGPFKFERWIPGQSLTMVRNPNYWQANPNGVDKITYRFIQNTNTLLVNLLSGQIDATSQVALANSPQTLDTLRKSARNVFDLYSVSSPAWEHLHVNKWASAQAAKDLGLDDARTRVALTQAIDRKTLATQLLGGTVVPTNTFVNNSSSLYWKGAADQYPYNPEAARKTLTDLGWKAGADGILERQVDGRNVKFVIEFVTTAGNAVRERNQQFIAENLKKVGIGIKINNAPSAVVFANDYIARASEGRWTGFFEFAWSSNPLLEQGNLWYCDDPAKTVREDGRPSKANGYQGQNHGGWCNKEYDQLWDQARREFDAGQRKAIFQKMQEVWVKELPVIPLYQRLEILTTRKGLVNYVWNGPTGNPANYAWLVGWSGRGAKQVVKQPAAP